MRILSISGQNIASLAQPFSIDFTAEPLNGAGLFVITGETGAGKSSILDAMCLALYGDAPRLAGAAGDEVPDPSGKSIKARDSRAVLRRGAAQGWAEVRFTARDGQDYIARWHARRARDRVDGQLQNVSRSLARVSDGQMLASQTTIVNDQIVELTGFSYDEFRRTVLLAQGDFDAFLRADTNDRAGLLEKVTGTGLYRAVSSRIYDRTEAARQVHSGLIQRREGHHILTDDFRAELVSERLVASQANQTAAGEIKTLQEGLARHARHAETERQVIIAETALEHALSAQGQANVDRELLLRIDMAAPLRSQWQMVQNAHTRIANATDMARAHSILADEANANVLALTETSSRAELEYTAQEDRFKIFGPLWDQAAALDSRIISATSELESARAQAEKAQQDETAAKAAFQTLQQKNVEAHALLQATENELAGLASDHALADSWAQVRQHITEHAEARSSLTHAMIDCSAHGDELERLNLVLADLVTRLKTDHDAEAKLAEDVSTLAKQIGAIEVLHPPGRGIQHQTLVAALADMRRAQQEHGSARSELRAAEAAAKAADEIIITAKQEAASSAEAMAVANAQVAVLSAPVERADMAVSDAAREMRLRLEPGKPCPVCGSADHPTHSDSALAELAAGLRADLAAARAAADDARTRHMEAQRAQDRAQADFELAGKNAQAATAKITTAQSHWEHARHQSLSVPLCPDLPDQIAGDPTELDALLAQASSAQQAEAAAQVELAELRRNLSEISGQRENLRKVVAEHAELRESLNSELLLTGNKHSLSLRAAEIAQAQVDRHSDAVSPLLQQLGETLEDPDLPARLQSRATKIFQLREARDSAITALSDLAPQMAKSESVKESAVKHCDLAKDAVAVRLTALQSLQAERAELLNGEATSAHRTRHNDARKAAAITRDNARDALASAANALAAARAKAESNASELSDAQEALVGAEAALTAALATTDLNRDSMDTLLAIDRTQIDALRQKLRALDDAVTSAKAALESRRMDHIEAKLAGLPEDPPEVLTEAVSVLDAANRTRAERIGAIDGELQRDVQSRTALAGLESEIAQARAELDVWEAVNHAAGSRSGDKFARIAQSITLDVLIDHANHHLADLNPRYRLRRAADLALQVEDRDMGDEARATRSLSGGERFLVSLALALALSRMGGKGGLASTLFIDEGFGSLDASSLDLAIDALESLQSQGRQVGVISHVEAMKERIPTRIAVRKQGSGKSAIEIVQG